MSEEGFGLLLPFDTDDTEFCRGVEAGRLWEMAKNEEGEFGQTIHSSNTEMAMRIAEATGRSFAAEELGDGWIEMTFGNRKEA